MNSNDYGRNETITNDTVGLDDDVDAVYKNIVKIITETAEKCSPRRCGKSFSNKKIRKCLPYWNDSCKNAIYNRNRARNKMNNNRTPENVQEYRRLKGIAQKTIKNSAATYWGDYCNTLNRTTKLSTIWRTMKKMNGVVENCETPQISDANLTAKSDKEKADLFARNFAAVSQDENLPGFFRLKKQETATLWMKNYVT